MPAVSLLEAQLAYENLGAFNLEAAISKLDERLDTFAKDPNSKVAVETAFAPIADYYTKLTTVNNTLQKYINVTAKNLADAEPRMASEERYTNRLHPEASVVPREITSNFFSYELKTSFLPYLISISVFLACLSIFLIFQMNGFSGQINIPHSPELEWFIQMLVSPAPTSTPMIFGGVLIIITIAVVIFFVLNTQAKNTNTQ